MPTEITPWIPPAVIVGVMLYLHRATRQDIKELRAELRGDIAELRVHVDTENGNLRGRMDTGIEDLRNRMGRLEKRMARFEGTLDVLRQFFVRNGRGNAA